MDKPKYLYRFFKRKKHRDEFLSGKVRFGRLEVYREIEDKERRDVDEGEARGKYKTDKLPYLNISKLTNKMVSGGFTSGDMHISGTNLDHNFIISFSGEEADLKLLTKKFGSFVAKVTDVDRMLNLLNKNNKFPWKIGRIYLVRVRYDKDQYIEMTAKSPHLPDDYYVAQKPESFVEEHEWRMILIGDAIEKVNHQYVTIEIGTIRDIATILDL